MDTRQAIRWDHNASEKLTIRLSYMQTASSSNNNGFWGDDNFPWLAAMRNIRHCYHRAARDAHMQLPLRWLWPRRFYAACSNLNSRVGTTQAHFQQYHRALREGANLRLLLIA